MALPSPLIPDARNWIDAYGAGYDRGDAIRRRNVLLEAGQLAAAGGGQQPVQPMAQPSQAAQGQALSLGARFRSAESGGRVDARNPNSSAFGPDQFTSGTWLDVLKRHRPQIAAGKSDTELLALRSNADLSGELRDIYTSENQNALRSAGLPVTDGTSYLSYFAGAGGARKALRADPSTPVTQILSPAAVRANPFLQNMTAADLRAWADKKMGGGAPAPIVQAAPAPTPVSDPNAGLRNASNALLRGGELQAGLGIQNQLYERSEKARAEAAGKEKEMQGIIGELALRADTPEKWARAVEVARRNGLKVDGLEDFSARELVLARSGKSPKYMSVNKRVFNETTGQFATDPASQGADNVSDGAGELEKGMRWRMKDGKLDLDASGRPIAEPIPGSPREAVTAEVAARIGLADKFKKDITSLRKEIKNGALEGADFYLNRGKAGDIMRRIEDGQEALVRNLTGAGMNLQEAESYAKRFAPGSLDTTETIVSKLDNLEKNLDSVQERVMIGRGASSTDREKAPPPAATARPRATNPQTGQTAEFNEQTGQWEIVQ